MLSFGRLLQIPYLLCANHSIHLAVRDNIFKKNSDTCHNQSLSSEDSAEEESDELEDDDMMENFNLEQDYEATVKKMREIVKIFRYSPLKAGILDEIQKSEGKTPLKPINDVVTRWNSLVTSGKRFLEILPSLIKSLKHKDIRSPIIWHDEDTQILQVLIRLLKTYVKVKASFFFVRKLSVCWTPPKSPPKDFLPRALIY